METFSYLAYGLCIHSSFPLPELATARTQAAPNIVLRLADVDRAPPDKAILGNGWWATTREVCLCYEGLGTILVRDGREMLVEPSPDLKGQAPRSVILGPALAILLHQRGLLVLHASAVRVNGAAAAFLGGGGWGKSTAAAALHARGHGILADDVLALAVDGTSAPVVLGAFPRLKLWPQVVSALGQNPESLPRVTPGQDKRYYRVDRGYRRGPTPLKCVYVLGGGSRVGITPLGVQNAFVQLVRHSYAAHLLEATGTASRHFEQCAQVINRVSVRLLHREQSLSSLPDLARLVEADVASSPAKPGLRSMPLAS